MPNAVLSYFVEREFGRFGKCWACVFRGKDKKGVDMPYAIVQFMVRALISIVSTHD